MSKAKQLTYDFLRRQSFRLNLRPWVEAVQPVLRTVFADQVKGKKTRRERIIGDLDLSGLRGVEIGPLSRPLLKKSEFDVYYVDHCATDELRKKYRDDPTVVAADVEEVDFVWKDEPMVKLVGDKAPLDYIVASHVIEHVPDLIGWLKEMRDALREGGELILVVPDKRFTFDVYRRLSALEEIEMAYREKRRRPGLRLVLDFFANVVTSDVAAWWKDYSEVGKARLIHPPDDLKRAADQFQEGNYVDVHCWVFTPWSFMDILEKIVDLPGLAFDLEFFETTPRFELEFYVRLKRVAVSKTDWKDQAKRARKTAIWPENLEQAKGMLI